MKFSLPTPLFALVCAASFVFASGSIQPLRATAQTAVLAEVYGRGVHAYHSGRIAQSHQLLSMAIDSGLQDPRAYYYRGLAAYSSGRPEEAESDWKDGAAIEARGDFGGSVGRALSRVQGTVRMELEMIREQARLAALTKQMDRSKIRYGELGAQPTPARTPVAPSATGNRRAATPPPAPATDNPFADDETAEPIVESDDALDAATKNASAANASSAQPNQPAPSSSPFDAESPGGNNPFDAPADDPFGAPAGASDDDPFGAPAGASGDDPFGTSSPSSSASPGGDDDPFGADPFGADPFGS